MGSLLAMACFFAASGDASGQAEISQAEISEAEISQAEISQAEKRTVELPAARMAYVEAGDREGRPVLFLHGIPTSSYLWRNVLPLVAAPGRRLIAIDFVGFGDSQGEGFGVAQQADHLAAFVERLDLKDVTLVTHDWGAGIGLIWASRHPERLRAFASMEGALPPVYPRPDLASFGKAAPLFTRLRDAESGPQAVLEDNVWVETILPASVIKPLGPEAFAAYRAPFPTPESRRPILDMTMSLPIGGEPAAVVAAYEEAAAWWLETGLPKLVLYADPGRLQPKALADWAAQNLKNVTTQPVGPGLHFIQEDSPEAIGRALDAWLAGLERNG
ncbi:haloalkane dehalogenase [Pelagibius sp.]